jgi:hypothetical protein
MNDSNFNGIYSSFRVGFVVPWGKPARVVAYYSTIMDRIREGFGPEWSFEPSEFTTSYNQGIYGVWKGLPLYKRISAAYRVLIGKALVIERGGEF